MMSLEEISNRFQIVDLLTSYCTAIDKNDIDALDSIFAENPNIDYSDAGGPKGNLQTIKKFLKENLGDLPRQHILSNFEFNFREDSADVRSLCHNPLELPTNKQVMLFGIWYHDKVIQTGGKWRIKEKTTHVCYHWKLQKIE